MADLIRTSGLVAARLNQGAVAEFGAAPRVRPAAASEPQPATVAARLELGPGRPGGEELPAEALRARQENLQRIETRMTALEEAGRLLAGAREGAQPGRAVLAERGPELAGRVGGGANLAEVLGGGGAAAADPEKLRNAELEAAGALLLARSEAGGERAALAREMVGAENEIARHADVERVERAAAPLRGQGAPEELVALSEALKASPMSRGRVLDLLAGGGIR
jgi:hypothetical protein